MNWARGTKIRCIHSRYGLTIGSIYTVISCGPLEDGATGVFVLDDHSIETGFYIFRFEKVEDHKEFTDDEYESLLV